jgi:hypothetical protein
VLLAALIIDEDDARPEIRTQKTLGLQSTGQAL